MTKNFFNAKNSTKIHAMKRSLLSIFALSIISLSVYSQDKPKILSPDTIFGDWVEPAKEITVISKQTVIVAVEPNPKVDKSFGFILGFCNKEKIFSIEEKAQE